MDAIVITLLPELMALMDSSWKISSEKSNFKVVVESRSSGAFLEFPSDEKIICTTLSGSREASGGSVVIGTSWFNRFVLGAVQIFKFRNKIFIIFSIILNNFDD